MSSLYPVLDVSDWTVDIHVSGGRDSNWWLSEANGQLWLFKPAVVREDRRQGEDWSEKATAHLEAMLGVPGAQVELAMHHGRPGCNARDLRQTSAVGHATPENMSMSPTAELVVSPPLAKP